MFKRLKEETGFTIIEVLIVLAIAGLIMVVVFIAVPQLQRNQRNERRKTIVSRIKTEIENYAGNNNGAYPTADTNATTGFDGGFRTRYLSNINYQNPQTGANMNLNEAQPANNAGGTSTDNLDYQLNRICNGEVSTTTGASARNYTLMVQLEGGASFCLDNR